MITCQKHLFSLDPGIHYFNNAYKAPLLTSCEEAAIKALKREKNPYTMTSLDFFREVDEVRAVFGRLINSETEDVAVIPAVSYGMASVLNNVRGEKGMKAITVENEFPSGYFALQKWCTLHEAELIVVSPDEEVRIKGESWNANVLAQIDERTALVVISSVHWMDGLKFDLEKIGERCKAVGATFIVDGTQSVGAMEMDVQKFNIDALICAAYKWLMGPYATGLAYIGKEFQQGIPLEESWMNRLHAEDFSNLTRYEERYRAGAGRYNMGESSNFMLMPMLHQSLLQIHEWRPERIQEYGRSLIRPLIRFLSDRGVVFENESHFSNHLFSLKLPEGTDQYRLKSKLEAEKIFISQRGDSLRASVNVFNTEEDVEKLIRVIDEALV